ncbi:cytochrome P450 [Streptomyces palmae]|uniref:Cytochrome P450 n=2 Tax=Streptomyces palmae TaxID=1701085 RepID=A0A4Z0HE90_9ACTN|nr:cytochrome P450 [Streptomyces palmae]TGB15807.1 cytochrome P450 [Streptomyces palmae]
MTTAQQDPIYNPLAPETIANPYLFYRRLRDSQRVYWHEVLDSWVVTGHAECQQILSDTAAFGSDFRRVGEAVPDAHLSVQSLDPPEHGAIRHLLVSALHEQSPAAMKGRAAAIAADHVARLSRQGRPVDLVREFARPVALRTMCEFLGVENPDGPWFEDISNAIVRGMDAGLDPSRAEPGTTARRELSRLVGGWIGDAGEEGFIGAVRRASAQEPSVSPELLANSMRAVLHAGYESVSRLLGNALARLVADPDLLSAVSAPSGFDALVDELIRLDGPVQADARVCVTDSSLADKEIRRGDVVVLFLAAANRDPAVFPHPDDVDLTRRKGLHLAFGRGAHACLGAGMAMLQLRAVLTALAESGLGFALAESPEYESTATLRGLSSLIVSVQGSR